jgi:tetratricopeptide (TPR) repeat protein
MPDPFSLSVCAMKTVAAAASLLAAGDKGVSCESTAKAIEALMRGGEAVKDVRELDQRDFAHALKNAAKRLEAIYQDSLRHGHSPKFRESVELAFANFSEVTARCLPTREALARLNHDPEKIAAVVVDEALKIQLDVFADPTGEARKILILLVSQTYSALRGDAKFMASHEGVNWAEALARLETLDGKIERIDSEAERRHRESMAATDALRVEMAREKGVAAEVLTPLFDHLGMSGLSVLQMRERAEEAIAAILAKANERVAPSNLGADIDAIIAAARVKLARLDTAGAETILDDQIAEEEAAFRRRQVPLLWEKAAVQRLSYNHEGAKLTLRRLLDLDPNSVRAWGELGDIWRITGPLAEALKNYRFAAEAAERSKDERGLSVSYERIGDVLVSQGNLPEALKSYQAGLAIRERLARTDAGNSGWQRDLSVSNNKIGDVLVSQGNLPEALKSYQAGLVIAERLAKTDAGNSDWQRDLSISYGRIGDVLVRQGNLPEALKSYQTGHVIAERLARTDAGNSDWQRDLSHSYDRIGDVLVRQGNLPEALKSYQAGLAIAERLARTDAGNSDWQRDLSVSNSKIGDVLIRQGNLPEALKSYQAGLVIAERLARTDAGNSDWQRDLIVSCVKIAEVFPGEARAMLTRAGAIASRLRDEGRLAPVDAWMPDDLASRLAALPGSAT